jgi:uncharacterized membrane protein YccC
VARGAGRAWSRPAVSRAVRAAVVVPAVLAFAFKVVGDPQMATYATFGGFANLVLAPFAGSRRDRFVAHLGLGVAGSALLAAGTAVHGSLVLVGATTLVVTFVVLIAGVLGPNIAAGSLAVMLAYVLSAASPGTAAMIPARVEGWWLGTVVSGAVVLLTTSTRPTDHLRQVAAAVARALADEVHAIAAGSADPALRAASSEALERMRAAFNALPARPTGLATVDQAVNNILETFEWVTDLVADTDADLDQLGEIDGPDRALLVCAGEVLDAVAGMIAGGDVTPDLDRLERLRHDDIEALRRLDGDDSHVEAAVHASFHARAIALAVRTVAADALIATRRATPREVAEKRRQWLPAQAVANRRPGRLAILVTDRFSGLAEASTYVRHASLRSVWTRNSARGAVAVAAAVLLADYTDVQHGFWVVLGTLSVLRTTATATGGTALRALLGTVVGVLIGAAVVVAVGTDTTVLWAILPFAVLIAAYTPGVAPFAAGQAAFTAMLVVLYNLLVPVGWHVGVVRVEDIAAGCGISLVVGALLWPRGATAVVTEDLQDAFAAGGTYLAEATDWALGRTTQRPASGQAALLAGLRLDDALRAFLTEQGGKVVGKEDLWSLVGAAQRLRLTAASLAELPAPGGTVALGGELSARAKVLAEWYASVATHIRDERSPVLTELQPYPALAADLQLAGYRRACQAFVDQHLRHLQRHHVEVIEPAVNLARAARRAWWHPGTSPLGAQPSVSVP